MCPNQYPTLSPRTAAVKAQRLKGAKEIRPEAESRPAVNRRLSPGRKKPKNKPDSANTMRKIARSANGPAQVRRYNESIMGTLYVVATPIGNLEDITLRAKRILLDTQIIACEDTRHTGNLISLIRGTPFRLEGGPPSKRYISIRDFNEAQVIDKILLELENSDVALVSDAGTPLISDPGFKLVRKCKELNINVVPIPGANAAITALSASGLPTNKFLFLGFLPKKWEIREEETTIIYESPIRIEKTVSEIISRYPDAKIVLAHELTKVHEEINLLSTWPLALSPKGEYTILVYRPKDFSQSYPKEN